ncbi:MAG: DNA polymerase/3'-5' exonuclease PolX, partial [Planctomycetota bacterium]|nr:DNA polymerase/3'-5' exonuclease PolX [Planctomycetota bacterium]
SILELPRMGKKTVENMKAAMDFAARAGERTPIGVALPIAEVICERLRKLKAAKQVEFAGSLRRGRDTIGDIDILVATSDPAAISTAFREMPEVTQVLAAGETKSSVRLQAMDSAARTHVLQADLRVVAPEAFGAALHYFTGSKEHNVRVRERALKMGYTLNEYGLFPLDDEKTPPQQRGVKPTASRTEEQVFQKLDLPYIPPEIREDRGELTAPTKLLESLITLEDIKSELHAHTTASDGQLSLEELVEEAKRRGFHTIAVTDHSKSQPVANGLSPERLLAHIEAIHELDSKIKGIKVLAGSEVDIMPDGRLDYEDKLLEQLDIVVASPHHALKQSPKDATKRLLKAIKHPLVHIVGHPTGRLVGRREGLSPDLEALIAAAVEHDTALEVNAHWMRLDLRDVHVRAAVEAGARIAIDCDVHAVSDFDNLRFGVITARRGWLTRDACINAWPARKLHTWLKKKRSG